MKAMERLCVDVLRLKRFSKSLLWMLKSSGEFTCCRPFSMENSLLEVCEPSVIMKVLFVTMSHTRERVLSTRYERWLKQPFFLFVFDAQKNRILKET